MDTCTPSLDLVVNTKQKQTKFVTGTKIDLMKSVKDLILVDKGANGSLHQISAGYMVVNILKLPRTLWWETVSNFKF